MPASATDPAALTSEVYVAGLRGTLQPELLGATRRHGLIPYVLAPEWSALDAELAAGRPVLVLENFGLPRVPIWHYAVVVGIDPQQDRVILRSGRKRRRLEHRAQFLRRWQLGHEWAFVAVAPGELPASATPALYVERSRAPSRCSLRPARPLRSPPRSSAGRTTTSCCSPRPATRSPTATSRLRRALPTVLAIAPRNAAARNNFANVLAEQGCRGAALEQARAALADVAQATRSTTRSAIPSRRSSARRGRLRRPAAHEWLARAADRGGRADGASRALRRKRRNGRFQLLSNPRRDGARRNGARAARVRGARRSARRCGCPRDRSGGRAQRAVTRRGVSEQLAELPRRRHGGAVSAARPSRRAERREP